MQNWNQTTNSTHGGVHISTRHGKKHPDTLAFDDSHLFLRFQGAPVKITELIVAHTNQNIIGLQAVYRVLGWNQIVSGPENFGTNHENIVKDVIHLKDDEYIIEIFGRNGDIFDFIGFRTSTGRSWEFGGPGGDSFKVHAPEGKHFNILKGGLGGHLHNIDFHTAPIPTTQGVQPSVQPSFQPNVQPSFQPNIQPGFQPSTTPNLHSTLHPTHPSPMSHVKTNPEEYFVGKTHNDTHVFNDALVVEPAGGLHKIHSITIHANKKEIFGLQIKYGIIGTKKVIEGPAHVGSDASGFFVGPVKKEIFELEKGEYITEIFGKSAGIMKSIGFITNTRRKIEFGGVDGDYYHIKAPAGHHFSTAAGGIGGHLHNINFAVSPIDNQYLVGEIHDDTQVFSDQKIVKSSGGLHKIHSITVHSNKKDIFGLQANYISAGSDTISEGSLHMGSDYNGFFVGKVGKETLQLESDEYITEIYGMKGGWLKHIGFTTNKGRKAEFGGTEGEYFHVKASSGYHFSILRGGLGGHIHNINFAASPIYEQVTQFKGQGTQFKDQEFRRGKTHGDTVPFSDINLLQNFPPTTKIYKLTIYHDKHFIFGWKADYFVYGPNVVVEGEKHVGNKWQGGVEDVVELASDEYITEIFGRNGDIMDSFGFATNKGRKFNFGGSGGNAFEVKAPQGYHFGTLGGGLGGHVHNVEFRPVPIQSGW